MVAGQGSGQEPIVARVVDSAVEDPVEPEDPEFLVEFVLFRSCWGISIRALQTAGGLGPVGMSCQWCTGRRGLAGIGRM